MKTIGLLGGLSPESTKKYYEWLNDGVEHRLGQDHSAEVIISTVDYGQFNDLKLKNDWDTQAKILAQKAAGLEAGGADFIILATNTMHKVAEEIKGAIKIPFLHMADATAERAIEQQFNKVAFIGTIYSMEERFYTDRLKDKGLDVLIPEAADDRRLIEDVIRTELTRGITTEKSRADFVRIIESLKARGADAVILGCTEINMLVHEQNSPLPVLDTTRIHVESALDLVFR